MSKNWELLQKLGKDEEAVGPLAEAAQPVKVVSLAAPRAAAIPAPALAAAPVPEKPGLEPIVGLVQQVFLTPGAEAPRRVVFVSTEPGTGCTWVCARTAEVLAGRVAGSICVVDANLQDPSLHQQFEVANGPGLSEALIQPDPIRTFVRPLSLPNLWLISSGSSQEAAKSLISSDRMRLRVTELRSEFDFVLIDCSAMSVSNDAIALGANSDGALLVIKANASRRENAKQALQDLQAGQAKVLGAVLNQRTYPIPEAIYKRL